MVQKEKYRNGLEPGCSGFSLGLRIVILLLITSIELAAQLDTVAVPDFYETGKEGNLNTAVKDAINSGTLSNTVFRLQQNGYYVLTDSIYIPAGEHLTIIAPDPGNTQNTAPPQILCATNDNSPFFMSYMFYCSGDITLKNIWLYYANTEGYQNGVSLMIHNSSGEVRQKGVFENVIFDYSSLGKDAGGAVTIKSKHFTGSFINCYWKNCTNATYRYYGRAISFPFQSSGWHIDSLNFENCTFANIGYVLMQENEQYSDYVKFNHCTFLNTTMFTMQSGWWYKLSVANSIFVNAYMMGYTKRQIAQPDGGTIEIDSISNFGFHVPFNEQDRRILFANSSYGIEKWLQDYMWNNPESIEYRLQGEFDRIPQPQPMMNESTISFFESEDFPYMNKSELYDHSFPGFIYPPTDTIAIKEFLLCDWFSGCDINWEWKPENSLNQLWPLEENLAYTNDSLLSAGMNGFPLGDLYRWFPEIYKDWERQKESEYERIDTWLETGNDPGIVNVYEQLNTAIPADYKLYQNYPNPFNPLTKINYSIPERDHITIKIYDPLGREVLTLFDGIQQPGNYTVSFDGSSFSTGIYICRMKSDVFMDSKKLVLIK